MKKYNPNDLWARLLVDELEFLGVEHAILCAGSRSTPLTLAFTQNQNISCYSQVDERSGAFYALGLAKSIKKPVVVVSTSGTAGANFYPAIIEAKASSVPLIVITSDRPQELRISGANQTTDQVKMFNSHVNWDVDTIPPYIPEDEKVHQKLLNYIIHIGAQLYEKALWPRPGPVHLNFPFRKPLQGTSEQLKNLNNTIDEISPKRISISLGEFFPSKSQIHEIQDKINASEFIMIIAGPNAVGECEFDHLGTILKKLDAIALVDPLSGYRYQGSENDRMISTYDMLLLKNSENLTKPDLIIQIGDMPVSKHLGNWLTGYENEWCIISAYNHSRDAVLKSSTWYRFNPSHLATQLENINHQVNTEKSNTWITTNQLYQKKIRQLLDLNPRFEPSILQDIFDHLPKSTLFIANSLLPRHLDEFIHSSKNKLNLLSSRGVSGIDGTLSTALGMAMTSENAILITGDLAFYHDMNGLLAMQRYKIPLKIIIINNSGGAIFQRLPITQYDPPFSEYFKTEHQLSFNYIAKQFEINYEVIDLRYDNRENTSALTDKFQNLLSKEQGILEIMTDEKNLENMRQSILESLDQDN